MRPQSEIRVCLAAALMDGPGTCRQLAQRTGWSIGMTREALNNMVHAGDARKLQPIRVKGVCRPVPVYARAVRGEALGGPQEDACLSLIAAWAGIAAAPRVGVAV